MNSSAPEVDVYEKNEEEDEYDEELRRINTDKYTQEIDEITVTFGPLYRDLMQQRQACLGRRSLIMGQLNHFYYLWHTSRQYACSEYVRVMKSSISAIACTAMRSSSMQAHLEATHRILTAALERSTEMLTETNGLYAAEEQRLQSVVDALSCECASLNQRASGLISTRNAIINSIVDSYGVGEREKERQRQKNERLKIMGEWIVDETPCPNSHKYDADCRLCVYIYNQLGMGAFITHQSVAKRTEEGMRKRARTTTTTPKN